MSGPTLTEEDAHHPYCGGTHLLSGECILDGGMDEPTLPEEDREALGDWWDSDWPDTTAGAMGTLYDVVARIVARHRAEAAAAERERWIERLAPLCDDEWLRQRDRAMDMHGAKTHQWMRRGASAWERAAHDLRSVLNDLADYEDEWVDRHAAYMRWLNDGRDRAAVTQGREDAR